MTPAAKGTVVRARAGSSGDRPQRAMREERPVAEQMAEFVRRTERYATDDVHAVLRLCDSGRLRCSEKTRRPAAATVVEVAKTLSAGDFYPDEPIAAFAWPMLVQAGGLAEITGGKLQLTAKGRAALGKPAAGVVQALWRSWLTKGLIDEFSRVENIKGQRAANVLTAPKARRQKVSEALAAQPAGEWVDVDDLFGQMKQTARSPRVARSERALWKLYLEDPHYGSLGYAGFGDWELLEGRYTLAVLFEYAATLGLIDVAYDEPGGARDDYHENWGADYIGALSRYDGLRAVRLNDLGAYVLGLSMSYTPPEPEAPGRTVKVLPNLDVVAVGRLAPAELLVLATGAGSLILSHVNDSGFWLIKEFFNMTVPQTLKTWTVAETIIGVAGLVFTLLFSLLI